ncbi:18807_t:CDS:1, partial [Gigaspora rosea]
MRFFYWYCCWHSSIFGVAISQVVIFGIAVIVGSFSLVHYFIG